MNAHKLYPILLLSGLSLSASAQGDLYNTGTLRVDNGTTVFIPGALSNTASADLQLSGTLELKGDLSNDQSMSSYYGGLTLFSGATAQSLSGTAPYLSTDAELNTAGLTLNGNSMWIDGTATFTNGIVTAATASAPLLFTTTGSPVSPSDASHVNGWVQKMGTGSFTYPVGDGSAYEPVTTNLSANGSGMLAYYYPADASSTAGFTAPLLYANHKEYWELQPVSTASGTVTIHWDALNNVGIYNTADLVVAHLSGGTWQSEGASGTTGTTAAGSVSSSNTISSWSPFTLGSISSNSPLPTLLVSFNGKSYETYDLLEWATRDEQHMRRYVLQHAAEGQDFTDIGTLDAANTAQHNYTLRYNDPVPGKNFYRLRMENQDGTQQLSNTVLLQRQATEDLALYPNPARQEITLQVPAKRIGAAVRIYNAAGQFMLEQTIRQQTEAINIKSLPAGAYHIRLEGSTANLHFVKYE